MSRFVFKFEELLNHRRHLRDLVRKRFGQAREIRMRLASQRSQILSAQESLIRDLRLLNGTGTININRSTSRQVYAGQLSTQLAVLAEHRRQAVTDVESCERDLVRVDQDVKSLESLRDKHQHEFLYDQARRDAHSLEDSCFAARQVTSAS